MCATKLAQAAFDEDLPEVRRLLAAGADPNEVSQEGWSALHAAIEQLNVEIVRTLIASGADPNLVDLNRWTPLFHAVDAACDAASQLGYRAPDAQGLEVIQLLLQNGADPSAHSTPTATTRLLPAQLARHYGQDELANLLDSIARAS